MIASFGIADAACLRTLQPALARVLGTSTGPYIARQLGGFNNTVPCSCTPDCRTSEIIIINPNVTCVTDQCLCTNTIANTVRNCILCAIAVDGAAYTPATVDASFNQFVTSCANTGFPISGVSTTSFSANTTTASASADIQLSTRRKSAWAPSVFWSLLLLVPLFFYESE